MNNKAIKSIQERFSVLINQPLQHISRGGGSIFVEFGDLIEKNSLYRTDDGKATIKKELAGKYALHVECNSRFVLGNKVILGKYDLYKPTSEKAKTPDFDWDSFDWDIYGNNLFDEKVKSYFQNELPKYLVKKVLVSKFGDLSITFSDNLCLEIFIDTSSEDECWRFFEAGNKEKPHLVISGIGFEEE